MNSHPNHLSFVSFKPLMYSSLSSQVENFKYLYLSKNTMITRQFLKTPGFIPPVVSGYLQKTLKEGLFLPSAVICRMLIKKKLENVISICR